MDKFKNTVCPNCGDPNCGSDMLAIIDKSLALLILEAMIVQQKIVNPANRAELASAINTFASTQQMIGILKILRSVYDGSAATANAQFGDPDVEAVLSKIFLQQPA